MRVFASLGELREAAGADLGATGWRVVTQEHIDAFAGATGDHQWIHVDLERAALGPFGATIAHGFLTLALCSSLLRELYEVQGVAMVINYGVNRVRFPAPLLAGSRVRARARLDSIDEVAGGLQVVTHVEVEREGADKPCCVAELVTRFLG